MIVGIYWQCEPTPSCLRVLHFQTNAAPMSWGDGQVGFSAAIVGTTAGAVVAGACGDEGTVVVGSAVHCAVSAASVVAAADMPIFRSFSDWQLAAEQWVVVVEASPYLSLYQSWSWTTWWSIPILRHFVPWWIAPQSPDLKRCLVLLWSTSTSTSMVLRWNEKSMRPA